jgi:hypothetical protein
MALSYKIWHCHTKYGTVIQTTDDTPCACTLHTGKPGLKSYVQNMIYAMIFHGKNCEANAAQYDITHALSTLYFIPHLRPGLPSCLTFKLTHQNYVRRSSPHHTCHMPRPSHPSWFYHPNNIWRKVQVIGHRSNNHAIFFIPYYSTHLRPQYLSSLSNVALNSSFMAVSYEQPQIATKLRMIWYDIFNCNWVATRWQ